MENGISVARGGTRPVHFADPIVFSRTMAPQVVQPQKVTVAWDFDATLRYFPAMDQLGIRLSDEFKDWVRQPNRLVLEDIPRRRRFVIQHSQFTFEVDGPDSTESVIGAIERIHTASHAVFEVETFKRLAIVCCFVLTVSGDFAAIVSRLRQRCFASDTRFAAPFGEDAYMSDLAFIQEYTLNKKQATANCVLAAMKRQEYFAKHHHEPRLFPKGSLKEYQDQFPDPFLYFSIAQAYPSVKGTDLPSLVNQAMKLSDEAARNYLGIYFNRAN